VARRRFFVPTFEDGYALLTGDDAQHLVRVLRAQPGQRCELSDNHSVQLAEIVEVARNAVRFRLLEPVDAPLPPRRVTLCAALIKFDRFEWMVEKATELGVAAIQPIAAERSETGLLAAAGKRLERWRRIARESSEQSRRATMPEILTPVRLDAASAAGYATRIRLEEQAGAPLLAQVLPAADPMAILIGPEGGWTEGERERLAGQWTAVSLGNQILRAETAAVAALAVVMCL
jgi:16S rRNA (uracil1498-N3)-methyltransferase